MLKFKINITTSVVKDSVLSSFLLSVHPLLVPEMMLWQKMFHLIKLYYTYPGFFSEMSHSDIKTNVIIVVCTMA